MKNREFYKEEILDFMTRSKDFCTNFIAPKILGSYGLDCSGVRCSYCEILKTIWLEEEYKEPEVDWTKVEVDTPIWVRDAECDNWKKKTFCLL